ncbi:hypothetical protein CD30_09625 [Ureibacillus massiliensis 4400831 = CIP 108448 = CCUG 49529]|uniref:YtkA-like domain-containing protein n=1 Tax=Ureibacillus massiliensis 4400831 = CIP 108448 = CCUG 49529 TaxID=1211035 RepID=A0A0A3J1L1_9BACL|nr:FixH family protein [Ureibacillus massiliensis]KGR90786.1 hypothetical protein CD30_09625 [Ureibacillus massiliensis 4400831 = CIP 108448 = CCUG 49529]
MKNWLISLFVISVLLVGCSSGETPAATDEIDVAALEVKVEILTPEKVEVNEPVQLVAHVQQNGENVDDAEWVKFEVWESGFRDQGQMIEGTLEGDGKYVAEITFDHDGVYYMYAHTTARGMHVMPKHQMTVGNPDMSKVIEDTNDDSTMNMDDMEGHDSSEMDSSEMESSEMHEGH